MTSHSRGGIYGEFQSIQRDVEEIFISCLKTLKLHKQIGVVMGQNACCAFKMFVSARQSNKVIHCLLIWTAFIVITVSNNIPK